MSTRDAALPSRSRGTRRIAGRIAWRTARRHPGRSALIAALVALPTMGLAAGTVLIASTIPTTEERLAYTLGATEAMVQVYSPPDATLEQSPTVPGWAQGAVDENYAPTGYDPDDPLLSPEDALPAGTRILTITESNATVRTEAGIDAVTVVEGDAGDPALEGRYHLADGRAPQRDGEIALTASALTRLGVELGDTLRITEPQALETTVVGVIEDQARARGDAVLFARDGAISGVRSGDDPARSFFYLPDAELDWDAVRELNHQGLIAYSRQVVEHPPAPGSYTVGAEGGSWTDDINAGYLSLLLLIGGFAIFQVCLLAGAALVVGMRADQRALATVASVGGDPRLVARIVSMGGVVLGGVGGLVGLGLGVLVAWGYSAIADDGSAVTLPGFHPWLYVLLPVLAIAVLAGWIAALAAARGARRIDVVAALRGSRRPRPVRPRRAVAGVVVAIVGAGLLALGGLAAVLSYWPKFDAKLVVVAIGVLVIGAVVLQLGLVLTTPALLSATSRILSRFGEGARLASRDASRNHARSVPAAAAVMSTVFVAVFLMTYLSSSQKTMEEGWTYEAPKGTISGSLVPSLPDGSRTFPGAAQVRDMQELFTSVLDGADTHVLETVLDPQPWAPAIDEAAWVTPRVHGEAPCDTDEYGNPLGPCTQPFPYRLGTGERMYVGDVDDLRVIIGQEPSTDAIRMLKDAGAITFWPEYVEGGRLTLDTWTDAQIHDGSFDAGAYPVSTVTLPALHLDPGMSLDAGVLISRATADALGLDYGPTRITAALDAAPTDQQYQALWAGMPTIIEQTWARYEAGPPAYGEGFAWVLLGLTGLITFAAASVAIGLARADGRRDEEVLDALGAPPGLRRGVAFWQAIVIAGIGTLLGAAVGLLPTLTLFLATLLGSTQDGWEGGGPLQDFAPPWLQLGLVVLVLPLMIALGSWATAARRRVAVRRVA